MTWFRVDDSFPTHPKVRAIPRARRLHIVGLWTNSGAWCSKHLTDGHIALDSVLDEGGKAADAMALCVAGLWHPPGHACPRCPQPAVRSYLFHDWMDWQPSKARVEADRKAESERKAAWREAKRKAREDKGGGDGDGDVPPGQERPQGVTSGGTDVGVPLFPTRPDPTLRTSTHLLAVVGRLAGAVGLPPAEVLAGWQEMAGGADLETEAKAYLLRNADRPARDERGAWFGWLRAAARRCAAAPASLGCGSCDDGWLGLNDDMAPIPCRSCRPHLRSAS